MRPSSSTVLQGRGGVGKSAQNLRGGGGRLACSDGGSQRFEQVVVLLGGVSLHGGRSRCFEQVLVPLGGVGLNGGDPVSQRCLSGGWARRTRWLVRCSPRATSSSWSWPSSRSSSTKSWRASTAHSRTCSLSSWSTTPEPTLGTEASTPWSSSWTPETGN
jgi:hypothetical protein